MNQNRLKDQLVLFESPPQYMIEEIEKMTDMQLVELWKDLLFINYIYGQIGVDQLLRINLIELEFEERPDIDAEELSKWANQVFSEYTMKL